MAEADKRRIVSEKWYLGETLGKGGYGFVKCGYHIKNNKPFALKFMRKSEKDEEKWAREQAQMVATEINALKAVDNKHVLKLFAYNLRCQYPNKDGTSFDTVLLVLELAPGGELFDILYYTDKLPVMMARTYFSQLGLGLQAIHAANICHRDLKPQNLLLNKRFQLKITDFGLAKIFKDDTSAKQKVMETSYVGTKGYQAPEILLKRKYTTKCDVFSCGVVLFILLTGYPPFEEATGSDGWYRKICQKKFKDFWDKHRDSGFSESDGSRELMQKCIAYQPMERYKVAEMLADPWTSAEKLTEKDLEKAMRQLHAKAVKKKKNDARKQKQLQTSVVPRAMESEIPVYDAVSLSPHRIFALKPLKELDTGLIMPMIEDGIAACQGIFKRTDDDEWHIQGHVTRAKDKKTFDIEAKMFRRSAANDRAFLYLHIVDDGDFAAKIPTEEKRKKKKASKSEEMREEEVEPQVKASASVSDTVRRAIWDRIARFMDPDYEQQDEEFIDIDYDDMDMDDFNIPLGYEIAET